VVSTADDRFDALVRFFHTRMRAGGSRGRMVGPTDERPRHPSPDDRRLELQAGDPLWLLALGALPLAVWLRGRARVPVLLVPFAAAWHRSSIAASQWTAGCAVAGLVLVIGALARPQRIEDKREVRSQGYDIMLAVDLSGSMLSEDYEKDGERINRLQAIKPVIQAFIEQRTSDRIGVVLFSSKAYTLAPLTTDHAWLSKQLERVKIGLIEDGTAIGDALGVALTRLDQSGDSNGKRKGAFIVLLTDGANNMGAITPMQSAQLAKARGIPIYTIGAGKDGSCPTPSLTTTARRSATAGSLPTSTRTRSGHRRDDGRQVLQGGRHRHDRVRVQVDRLEPEDRVPGEELPPDDRALPLARRARASRSSAPGRGSPAPMTFAWPQLLWLLVLPAGLLVWELAAQARLAGTDHPKILRAEAGLTSVSLSPRSRPGGRARGAAFLLCAGIALGIVALARPQWGRLDEPVFDQSRDIIIALDLSRSMLTPDVKPSRLERSKLLIQSLLDRLKGERVGLVVFSGTAFLQSPLSADYEILREFLPALGPDFLPEGGTNYRQLIDTALEAFAGGSAADRYLIILSDGEATDEDWRQSIPDLAKRGIRVIGLGVGTSAGGMIPDGAGAFMKDENGAVVLSRLESGTLRELADATHGVYRDASDWVDLSKVLASTVEEGRKGRFVEQQQRSGTPSATSGRSRRPSCASSSRASGSNSRSARSRGTSA
jgi:Mg-chelatase subunit ChlD